MILISPGIRSLRAGVIQPALCPSDIPKRRHPEKTTPTPSSKAYYTEAMEFSQRFIATSVSAGPPASSRRESAAGTRKSRRSQPNECYNGQENFPFSDPFIDRKRKKNGENRDGKIEKIRFFGRKGNAGWSSPVARKAHNLEVVRSNRTPATMIIPISGVYAPLILFIIRKEVADAKDRSDYQAGEV